MTKVTIQFFLVVSDTIICTRLKRNRWCAASRAVLIGIVTGSVLLIVGLTLVGFYAVQQKKQAQRLVSVNNPFGNVLYSRVSLIFLFCNLMLLCHKRLFKFSASWGSMGEDIGEAPKLKSARFFTLEELKLCTNYFREINVIGAGGYGRVKKQFLCKLKMRYAFLVFTTDLQVFFNCNITGVSRKTSGWAVSSNQEIQGRVHAGWP